LTTKNHCCFDTNDSDRMYMDSLLLDKCPLYHIVFMYDCDEGLWKLAFVSAKRERSQRFSNEMGREKSNEKQNSFHGTMRLLRAAKFRRLSYFLYLKEKRGKKREHIQNTGS